MTETKLFKIKFLRDDGSTYVISLNYAYEYIKKSDIDNFLSAAAPVLGVVSVKEAFYYTTTKRELDI